MRGGECNRGSSILWSFRRAGVMSVSGVARRVGTRPETSRGGRVGCQAPSTSRLAHGVGFGIRWLASRLLRVGFGSRRWWYRGEW